MTMKKYEEESNSNMRRARAWLILTTACAVMWIILEIAQNCLGYK